MILIVHSHDLFLDAYDGTYMNGIYKLFCEIHPRTCGLIKQNESEVGSDMLLVSEVFILFQYNVNVNVKPDTCSKCLIDDTI